MLVVPMKVELVQKMGSDLSVVNAARVSFDKQSNVFDPERDAKLIRYLAKHNHWTPFGHASLTFRVKAPIFVARQLVKHQVGLVWNEVSRRYVDSPPEFWLPSVDSISGRPVTAKQGAADTLTDNQKRAVGTAFEGRTKSALDLYSALITYGVAPEQARMVLPLNTMTEWWWTGSLAAFARVCRLRLDPHAQKETTEIALSISRLASESFPVSWSALMDDYETIIDVTLNKDGTRELSIPGTGSAPQDQVGS